MQQRHLGGVYSRGGAALTTGPLNPPVRLGRGQMGKGSKGTWPSTSGPQARRPHRWGSPVGPPMTDPGAAPAQSSLEPCTRSGISKAAFNCGLEIEFYWRFPPAIGRV